MRQFSFRPEEKISLEKEVDRIFKQGRRLSEGALTLVWRERTAEEDLAARAKRGSRRFAMRLTRFPTAVMRNRIKRLFREVFRTEKWNLAPQTDYLILIRPVSEMEEWNFFLAREKFIALCGKAGVWIEPKAN